MVKLGIRPLENYLNDFDIKYKIFKDTIPEPTSESITQAVDILKEEVLTLLSHLGEVAP